MANQLHRLPDGRTLGVSSLGDPGSRRLVLVCHPTPGAGGFDPDPKATAESGLQFLMIDRPGYGASDPVARDVDPTIQQHADDLASYLSWSAGAATNATTADFGSIAVIGWGAGGGSTALSLAARHPEVVDRLVIVGTPRVDGPGLIDPVRRLLGLSRIEAFSPRSHLDRVIASHGEIGLQTLGIGAGSGAGSGSATAAAAAPEHAAPHGSGDAGAGQTGGFDVSARPGLRGRIERMLGDSSRQGAAGIATDLLAFRDRSWALDLPAITADTLLVYGTDDPLASARDGNWYRRRISGSRVHEAKGADASVYISEWPRILQHVADRSQ
ncbi:alpha/beta hydrolase [Subtercola sp. YIM 133946]|uniref:alpha/beta hydrolase n=1 Tax=Subtercola sp. YIM 133946 TaxID=3118909 RepID=UPI002F92C7E4